MLKHFRNAALAAVFTVISAIASAGPAVDANKATQAELETVKGIGPTVSTRVLEARKTGAFKDWPDLIDRVQGIGPAKAGKLSSEGLTVNGAGYTATAAAPATKAGKADAAEPKTKK